MSETGRLKNVELDLFQFISLNRKIHTLGFTVPDIMRSDKTENICYKYLKLEQAGERVLNIWNALK